MHPRSGLIIIAAAVLALAAAATAAPPPVDRAALLQRYSPVLIFGADEDWSPIPVERLLRDLGRCYVVLGNHDFADSRDPFSQRVDADALAGLEGVVLLTDQSAAVDLRGSRVQIVGVDPRSYASREAKPESMTDESANLRILLCHFPGIVKRIPGAFHLILAGHMHAGQIVVPYPGGKLRLAHLRAHDVEGVHEYGSTVLHVSPGLGTTFLPFRLFARPEVTELVVRSA